MAQRASQSKSAPAPAQTRQGGHTLRNIGLIIIAVFVIGGGYFYYEYLSGGIGGAVYAALTSGNPAQAIQTAALQKISSTPQLTLTYQGTITENVTVNGTDPVESFPFYMTYEKYYNVTRTTASFSGLPGLGNYSVVIINENSSAGLTVYACLNQGSGFTCTQSSGSAKLIEKNLSSSFGLSNLGNVNVGTPSPSYYNGMPCFQVQGTGILYGRTRLLQEANNATVNFAACFSSKYYVPLVLNATATPSGGAPITLHVVATNLTGASNYTAITTLPGPLS